MNLVVNRGTMSSTYQHPSTPTAAVKGQYEKQDQPLDFFSFLTGELQAAASNPHIPDTLSLHACNSMQHVFDHTYWEKDLGTLSLKPIDCIPESAQEKFGLLGDEYIELVVLDTSDRSVIAYYDPNSRSLMGVVDSCLESQSPDSVALEQARMPDAKKLLPQGSSDLDEFANQVRREQREQFEGKITSAIRALTLASDIKDHPVVLDLCRRLPEAGSTKDVIDSYVQAAGLDTQKLDVRDWAMVSGLIPGPYSDERPHLLSIAAILENIF